MHAPIAVRTKKIERSNWQARSYQRRQWRGPALMMMMKIDIVAVLLTDEMNLSVAPATVARPYDLGEDNASVIESITGNDWIKQGETV
ncbi:hypothetical protein KEM54_004099, partial [Ascosphaera aggregata]